MARDSVIPRLPRTRTGRGAANRPGPILRVPRTRAARRRHRRGALATPGQPGRGSLARASRRPRPRHAGPGPAAGSCPTARDSDSGSDPTESGGSESRFGRSNPPASAAAAPRLTEIQGQCRPWPLPSQCRPRGGRQAARPEPPSAGPSPPGPSRRASDGCIGSFQSTRLNSLRPHFAFWASSEMPYPPGGRQAARQARAAPGAPGHPGARRRGRRLGGPGPHPGLFLALVLAVPGTGRAAPPAHRPRAAAGFRA